MKRRRVQIVDRLPLAAAERALADLIAAERVKWPGINRNAAIQSLGEKVRPLLAISNFARRHRLDLCAVFEPTIAAAHADAEIEFAFARVRHDMIACAIKVARGEEVPKGCFGQWDRVHALIARLEHARYVQRYSENWARYCIGRRPQGSVADREMAGAARRQAEQVAQHRSQLAATRNLAREARP